MRQVIVLFILNFLLVSGAIAGELRQDLRVAQQCLVDSQRDHQFIVINKYQKKTLNKPAYFKSYVYDRKKKNWVDRFESLAGEGGIGCQSSSMKTPPGILEIKAEGSKLGAKHWGFDRQGYKKYFMDDISGNPCDLYAQKNGEKHRSHSRKIRFHSNIRMTKLKAGKEQSKGCFVISPQKFKQWGGGLHGQFPGNAIVYNVPPKGMRFSKIKCQPKNRVLTHYKK